MKNKTSVVTVNGSRYICLAELALLTPNGDEKAYHSPCYLDSETHFRNIAEVMADALKNQFSSKVNTLTLYKVVTRFEGGIETEDYEEVLTCKGELNYGK